MSEFNAINLLQRQLDAHVAALNAATTPAERSALLRNLSKHIGGWKRTLDKEAAYHESLALADFKAKHPKLEAA